jgi:hypothetical protein
LHSDGQYVFLGKKQQLPVVPENVGSVQVLLWHGNNQFQTGVNLKLYLYQAVIGICIEQQIHLSFDVGNPSVYAAWTRKQHYKECVDSGETIFFLLAVSSFQFLSDEITSLEFESQYQQIVP